MGAVSKRSETTAGPKLLAGLSAAPEIEPSAQMHTVMARPMLIVPHVLPEDEESVEPSTTITRIAVPMISARTEANIGIGRDRFGRLLPKLTPGIDAAAVPTNASSKTAATVAPMNCAAT